MARSVAQYLLILSSDTTFCRDPRPYPGRSRGPRADFSVVPVVSNGSGSLLLQDLFTVKISRLIYYTKLLGINFHNLQYVDFTQKSLFSKTCFIYLFTMSHFSELVVLYCTFPGSHRSPETCLKKVLSAGKY